MPGIPSRDERFEIHTPLIAGHVGHAKVSFRLGQASTAEKSATMTSLET